MASVGTTGRIGRITTSITRALGMHSEYTHLRQKYQEVEIPRRHALDLSYDRTDLTANHNPLISPLRTMSVIRLEDGRYFLRWGLANYAELFEGVPLVIRNMNGDPKFNFKAMTLQVEKDKLSFQDSTSTGIYYRSDFRPMEQGVLNCISQTHPAITKIDLATLSSRAPNLEVTLGHMILQRGQFAPGLNRPQSDNPHPEALPGKWIEIDSRKTKVIVTADKHALLQNIELILNKYGQALLEGKAHLVIKGDFFHPEEGDRADMTTSEQALRVLINLINRFPHSVTYEAGNHDKVAGGGEALIIKMGDQGKIIPQGTLFRLELEAKYGSEFVQKLQKFFEACPYKAIITSSRGKVVAGHTGAITMRMIRRNIPILPAGDLRKMIINAGYLDVSLGLDTLENFWRSLECLLTWGRPSHLDYGVVDKTEIWMYVSNLDARTFYELRKALFENPQDQYLRIKPGNWELSGILDNFVQQGKITAAQKTGLLNVLLDPHYSNRDLAEMRQELGLPPDTLVVTGHTHSPNEDSAYEPAGMDHMITLMDSSGRSSVLEIDDGVISVVDLAGQSPLGGKVIWTN